MRLWDNFRSILLTTLLLVLAGACAAPPPPAPEGDYYLTADMTYLRDKAAFDSNVVGQLYKSDQVERLDIGPSGWWRVRSGRLPIHSAVSALVMGAADGRLEDKALTLARGPEIGIYVFYHINNIN